MVAPPLPLSETVGFVKSLSCQPPPSPFSAKVSCDIHNLPAMTTITDETGSITSNLVSAASSLHRTVWLFARPLRSSFLDWLTRGNFVLNHWGVLVSDISCMDVEVTIQRSLRPAKNSMEATGTMYELYRTSDGKNVVRRTNPFSSSTWRDCWPSFAYQFVATTNLGDEEIFNLGLAP